MTDTIEGSAAAKAVARMTNADRRAKLAQEAADKAAERAAAKAPKKGKKNTARRSRGILAFAGVDVRYTALALSGNAQGALTTRIDSQTEVVDAALDSLKEAIGTNDPDAVMTASAAMQREKQILNALIAEKDRKVGGIEQREAMERNAARQIAALCKSYLISIATAGTPEAVKLLEVNARKLGEIDDDQRDIVTLAFAKLLESVSHVFPHAGLR